MQILNSYFLYIVVNTDGRNDDELELISQVDCGVVINSHGTNDPADFASFSTTTIQKSLHSV